MRAVNLLPDTGRRRPGLPAGRKPLAIAGAVAVLGTMGYWTHSVQSDAGQARDAVTAAAAERDGLQTRIAAYQQAQTRVADQAARRGAVVALAQGRVNWERLVRDLSAVMPRQVWLTNLKGETEAATADPAAAAAAPPGAPATIDAVVPRGIHLDGFAFTQPQIALLLSRVATVPGLGEPRLATSEAQERGGRQVVHFVIDIPIDQRAQDRPTLTASEGSAPATTAGVTP